MTWLTILVTALVTFGLAQLGAWLQARRDAANQERQQGAEIDRLRLQLEAQAAEAEARNELTDRLDWRSRRIDMWGSLTTAVSDFQRLAADVLRLTPKDGRKAEFADFDQAGDELMAKMSASRLISDAEMQGLGYAMVMAAFAVKVETFGVLYARQRINDERESHGESAELGSLIDESQAASSRWTKANSELGEAMQAWETCVHQRLGIPKDPSGANNSNEKG